MKVMVNCHCIYLESATGIQNFALSIIESVAGFVDEVVVDVTDQRELQFCRAYFESHENIICVLDPGWRLFTALRRRPLPFRLAGSLLQSTLSLAGVGTPDSWARRQGADVVFYPFHRIELRHQQVPVVTTVHAVLPEYTEKDMTIMERHVRSAQAIVTSWPHPWRDLSDRYPFLKDRLFLVPFTAVQNVAVREDGNISRLGVEEPFYLYAASVIPRKNHMNLIEAYGILKRQGKQSPLVVCTGGGGDEELTAALVKRASTLGVADRFLFLGRVPFDVMGALYHGCVAAISASHWEAGMAAIQEGGACGKPILCSDIAPAREHARLFGLDVCFFDPGDPDDMARQLTHFQENIQHFRDSAVRAQPMIRSVDLQYMGQCYSDILRFAAGQADKPEWAPFKIPDGFAAQVNSTADS